MKMQKGNRRPTRAVSGAAALTALVWGTFCVAATSSAAVQAAGPTRVIPSVSIATSGSYPGAASAPQSVRSRSARSIVRFSTPRALNDAVSAARASGTPVDQVWAKSVQGFSAALTSDQLQRLRADPTVLSIEPDSVMTASTDQSDPPWGLDRIDQRTLPLRHTYSYDSTGSGVTAYIVDTGARTTHTEFADRILKTAYIDVLGTAEDCNGHGTHVTGTIGGTTYGVAKRVSLIPVRVLDCSGSGSSSQIVTALEWIVGDHQPGVPAVVNMSLGGLESLAVDAAVNDVINDGVTVVVAAGNSNSDSCFSSPARVPSAITVGAADSNDAVAYFSNHGSCNDLFAPGVSVLSAWDTSDTATNVLKGTSMAAPHVTGAVARILADAPTDTPAQVAIALDDATTKGALTGITIGDPNKLLYLAPPPSAPQPSKEFVPVSPLRLFDSRPGFPQGAVPVTKQRFGGGNVLRVQATGVGGVPSSGVGAVSLNVTVSGPATAGFVTVFPCGAQPDVSSVNYVAGQTVPNAVIAPVSAAGEVCLFSSADTYLFADVNGWFASGTWFAPVQPVRLFDSRPGEDPGVVPIVKRRYGGVDILRVKVTGVGGVPLSGVGAVSLNVTVADPLAAGFVTVFPCGAQPSVSSVNYVAAQTVPNAVIAPVSATGEVCLFSSAAAFLVGDVNAWFADDAGFIPVVPVRVFDTRPSMSPGVVAVVKQRYGGAGNVLHVQVTGVGGVPLLGVGAVSLNVTVADAVAAGFITVFPCGAQPNVSSVNYVAGQTVPNAVIAPVSALGEVCLYSSADSYLFADVNGWFANG